MEDEPFHPTTFTKNRERLLEADAARVFLKEVVKEARLYRKAPQQEARLCYLAHLLTENRHGVVVDVELTQADGYAEREAALAMLERSVTGSATLGADRAYDTRDFVADVRGLGVTPHIAQNQQGRRSAIDRRTTRHPGYRRSQRRCKLAEEVFGWIKTVGTGGKLRNLGRARNKLWFELTAAACNLTRLAKLEAAAA